MLEVSRARAGLDYLVTAAAAVLIIDQCAVL